MLVEDAEMPQDIQDYDRAKAMIENGSDELIPADIVDAILNGKKAIKVWRDYRGLSQAQLAEKAAINTPYLSQMETGKRTGSVVSLPVIAKALHMSLDWIVQGED